MTENISSLPPRPPAAPDHARKKSIMLRIGGRRFELTHTIETREITRGPADVVEMPAQPEPGGRS